MKVVIIYPVYLLEKIGNKGNISSCPTYRNGMSLKSLHLYNRCQDKVKLSE